MKRKQMKKKKRERKKNFETHLLGGGLLGREQGPGDQGRARGESGARGGDLEGAAEEVGGEGSHFGRRFFLLLLRWKERRLEEGERKKEVVSAERFC